MSDAAVIAKYLSVPLSVAGHILEHGLTPRAIARADIPTLSDPFSHPGIPEAVEMLGAAARDRKRIVLECGRESDSIAAAATLQKALQKARAKSSLSSGGEIDLTVRLGGMGRADITVCPAPGGEEGGIAVGGADSIISLFAFHLSHALFLSKERFFGKKLVAVDTETTGKNTRGDEIIEIGAAVLEGNAVAETFQTLVNPGRRIPGEVSRITGIRNEDVADAPAAAQALSAFLDFIGDPEKTVLVAHNAEFDRDFLQNGVKKHLKRKIRFETIDTLEMARRLRPAGSHRLAHVAEKLGIEVEGWHRALGDAVMAAKIYFTLAREQNAELRDLKLKRYMDAASVGMVASSRALDSDCAAVIKNGLPRYRLDQCEEMASGLRGEPDPQRIVDLLLAGFFGRRKNQLGAVALLAPILKGETHR